MSVETRLTAEQFYDAHREFEHVPTLARKHFFGFAEAYAARLREEIERLKRERNRYRDSSRTHSDFRERAEAEAAALRERYAHAVKCMNRSCKECNEALSAAPERGKDGI